MIGELSFAEILEQKIKSHQSENLGEAIHIPNAQREPFSPWIDPILFFDHAPKKVSFSRENGQKIYQSAPRPTTASEKIDDSPLTSEPPISSKPPKEQEKITPTLPTKNLNPTAKAALKGLRDLGGLELYVVELSLPLVKKTYKRLCKKWHPDSSDAPSSQSNKRFIELQSHYQTLFFEMEKAISELYS